MFYQKLLAMVYGLLLLPIGSAYQHKTDGNRFASDVRVSFTLPQGMEYAHNRISNGFFNMVEKVSGGWAIINVQLNKGEFTPAELSTEHNAPVEFFR